jgi:hypothetical protein
MASPRLPRRSFLGGALAAAPAWAALAPRPAAAFPAREVYVYDGAQLARALAEALPGDRIVLIGAVFPGDFTAWRPGAPGAPVVVDGGVFLGTTITGRFTVRAADVIVNGLVVRRGIEIRADRSRARRCRVDGSGNESAVKIAAGAGAAVEFCELTNYRGRAVDVAGQARWPLIHRNWLHGQARGGISGTVAGMMIGDSKETSATPIRAHVLENLVEGLVVRQAIELKSSGNRVEGNTTLGTETDAADLLVRHGTDNVFVGNWVEDGRLLLQDARSVAVRNCCTGTRFAPRIGVTAGTISGDDLRRGISGYPFSEDARVVANEAVVEIGWRFPGRGRKPVRTRVEAQDKARWPVLESFVDPWEVAHGEVTDYDPLPEAPRRLTRADVGPYALLGPA